MKRTYRWLPFLLAAAALVGTPGCRFSLLAREGPVEEVEIQELVDHDLEFRRVPRPGAPALVGTLFEVVRVRPMLRNPDGALAANPFRSSYIDRVRAPDTAYSGAIRIAGEARSSPRIRSRPSS